ncbi:MAG: 30S ribosomal protein S6 [Elusimicrobiota bacterium]|jgi:small subunit ribosomal protein S6|nr:30S ribosomal protein S6 [Elusimicrobiota bacterium]
MNYESTFICSPDLPTEKVEELTSKTKSIIESAKGVVKSIQQLGKKKLAYPISKFREGSYVFIEYSVEGAAIGELESFFKLNDGIIRFLTIKIEKKKVDEKKPSKKSVETEVKDESTKQPTLA